MILLFGVIQDFFILNAVWFLFIILLYTLWIRHIFSPIRLINDRLQSFFHLTPIQKIPYTKQDEFQPLIETVHTLHTSLKAQEEIRSQFLSDLSHEIRTPMTSIQCMLEAIDDGIMKLDSNTIILIQNEITRLVTITNRVMDYESFLHSTQNITEKKSTPIQHTTDTIIQQYQPQLQKTEQKIIEHIPKNCIITLHSDLYIHILHNIFSNFIKYA